MLTPKLTECRSRISNTGVSYSGGLGLKCHLKALQVGADSGIYSHSRKIPRQYPIFECPFELVIT